MTFKSHVLLCYDGDETCPVCRFLDGATDQNTLIQVINVLDEALADERKYSRELQEILRSTVTERVQRERHK